jgi:hypothetical protein
MESIRYSKYYSTVTCAKKFSIYVRMRFADDPGIEERSFKG